MEILRSIISYSCHPEAYANNDTTSSHLTQCLQIIRSESQCGFCSDNDAVSVHFLDYEEYKIQDFIQIATRHSDEKGRK